MIRLDDLSPLIKETFNDHILTMLESFTKKKPYTWYIYRN